MALLLAAVWLLLLSGAVALLGGQRSRWVPAVGAGGTVAAALLGLAAAVPQLLLKRAAEHLTLAWNMPCGDLAFRLDGLSSFFLLPILVLSALAAVYGVGYLAPQAATRNLGRQWFFFNALVAAMVLVCLARQVLVFFLCWELMALSSFFLVAFDGERSEVRKAAFVYLIATHIGTAFLLPMFLLLARASASMDFAVMAAAHLSPASAGVCFVLALVGFGAKAGFIPFHIWLPEAHPAAPSQISAVMSGVMIKTGIYGLVRVLTLLGPPPFWWGCTLLAVGSVSGVLGVLFAIAQHDLKRLLAYSSVENIGIIAMGLGTGLLGISTGQPTVAVLGFAGGLLHVLNHALFKGLLFLGAGAVLHATHTREMDHLGGLLKRMPGTGTTFLVGAAAISGLPPLNGFVSEFLIYLGLFTGVISLGIKGAIPALGGIFALVLIGGLAAATFAKAFGIVFLGEPRTTHAAAAHEAGALLLWPLRLLAGACVVVGLSGPWVVLAMAPVLATLLGGDPLPALGEAAAILTRITLAGAILGLLVALLAGLRYGLFRHGRAGQTVTWACGYTAPSPSMQYTAASFAQPITEFFAVLLRTRRHINLPTSYFPTTAQHQTKTPDVWHEEFYRPLFMTVRQLLSHSRVFQAGSIHAYVLYQVLILLVLLLWKLG